MKRLLIIVLLLSLGACNPVAWRYPQWQSESKDALLSWDQCAFNSTQSMVGKYTDPAFIAGYSVHKCEPYKLAYSEKVLENTAVYRDMHAKFLVDHEVRLRDKMQLLATKWLADEEAKLNAQFPVEMDFR